MYKVQLKIFSPGPTVYICPAWAAVHRGVRWANYGVTRVRWGPGNPVRHSPTPGGGGVGKGGHGCQDNIHRDNRHWLAGYRSGSAGSFLVVLFLILNNSGTKIEDADWFQDYISTPLPSPERNWELKQKVLFYFEKYYICLLGFSRDAARYSIPLSVWSRSLLLSIPISKKLVLTTFSLLHLGKSPRFRHKLK
jgi:hypothetical protein